MSIPQALSSRQMCSVLETSALWDQPQAIAFYLWLFLSLPCNICSSCSADLSHPPQIPSPFMALDHFAPSLLPMGHYFSHCLGDQSSHILFLFHTQGLEASGGIHLFLWIEVSANSWSQHYLSIWCYSSMLLPFSDQVHSLLQLLQTITNFPISLSQQTSDQDNRSWVLCP